MPKGKAKGRRGGETKAERALRRAIACELPAIKAVAECCHGFRDEWRECGGGGADGDAESAVSLWERVDTSRDGVEVLRLCTRIVQGSQSCDSLVALPDAIGDFASLRMLDLDGCKNLLALPDTIGKLESLISLDLTGCESLTALPHAIGELRALQRFMLEDCSSLTALPHAIGELDELRRLILISCSSLTALPESIGGLSALQTISLFGCNTTANNSTI